MHFRSSKEAEKVAEICVAVQNLQNGSKFTVGEILTKNATDYFKIQRLLSV